jgi:hypothetical protein
VWLVKIKSPDQKKFYGNGVIVVRNNGRPVMATARHVIEQAREELGEDPVAILNCDIGNPRKLNHIVDFNYDIAIYDVGHVQGQKFATDEGVRRIPFPRFAVFKESYPVYITAIKPQGYHVIERSSTNYLKRVLTSGLDGDHGTLRLYCEADTTPGMSGCPYMQGPFVVGIHHGHDSTTNENFACAISRDVLDKHLN